MSRASLVLCAIALLGGCTIGPVMDPNLDPVTRFELLAFREDDGTPTDEMFKWPTSRYTIVYDGPPKYRAETFEVMHRIGELTGLETGEDDMFAKVRVQISDRVPMVGEEGWTCHVSSGGGNAFIHIHADLPPREITQCLWQEMGQALGLGGDLDGPGYSRADTVFASYGGADSFTPEDEMMIRILFDPRLRDGMSRAQAMPIVRQIVAEMEAQQEAGR